MNGPLGLSHSSVEGSLMYPWYSMEIPQDARLPLDDRIAIQHLYGPNKNNLYGDNGGKTINASSFYRSQKMYIHLGQSQTSHTKSNLHSVSLIFVPAQ